MVVVVVVVVMTTTTLHAVCGIALGYGLDDRGFESR
jgi:hypothetical protein